MQRYNNCKDGYNDLKPRDKVAITHLSRLTFHGIAAKVAGKSPSCRWEVLHLSIVSTRLEDELLSGFPILVGGLTWSEVTQMRLRFYPSAYIILPA